MLVGDDPLTTHPRLIDELPRVAQRALDEIERTTGFKAILVVGGLTPIDGGAISTNLYVPFLLFAYLTTYMIQSHNRVFHHNRVNVLGVMGWMC